MTCLFRDGNGKEDLFLCVKKPIVLHCLAHYLDFFRFHAKKFFFISFLWETHYSISARFADGQALPVLPAQLRPGGLHPGGLLPAWGGLVLDTALLSRGELFDLRKHLEFPNNFFSIITHRSCAPASATPTPPTASSTTASSRPRCGRTPGRS